MTDLIVKSLTYLNPFQPSSHHSHQIPGPTLLAHLLPNHSDHLPDLPAPLGKHARVSVHRYSI